MKISPKNKKVNGAEGEIRFSNGDKGFCVEAMVAGPIQALDTMLEE